MIVFGSYDYISCYKLKKYLSPNFKQQDVFFRLATMFTSKLNISVSPILQVNSSCFVASSPPKMSGRKKLHHFEEHFLGQQAITITISGACSPPRKARRILHPCPTKTDHQNKASTSITNRKATTFSV